jgi:8-oxo-dGTP pyrophosphatase MutT (NUDIX family)
MNFQSIQAALKKFSIDKELTALAQKEVAPLRNNAFDDSVVKQAKKAGVLLLIHSVNGIANLTLIERPQYDGAHSSQIALPGGKVEKEDINITETALREAKEEVNINPDQVKIVGQLTSIYIPPSNFFVTPILAISSARPNYVAEEREVKSILEVPLSELIHPQVLKETKITLKKGIRIKTPYLDLQGKIVWGATAMILNEFRHHLMTLNL